MSIRFTAQKNCVSSIKVKSAPEGRYGHRSVLFEDKVYFFGGYNGSRRLNDIHEFDTFTQKWRKIRTVGRCSPRPRDCHSCVLYKDNIVVFGGGTGYQWMCDLFFFHIPSRRWHKKCQSGDIPQGRAGHSAVVHGDKMYIFGGWNGYTTLNDLYCLDLRTYVWEAIEGRGVVPERRDSHCAIMVKDEMVIIGGGDGHKRLNDMYRYIISKRKWKKIFYEGCEEDQKRNVYNRRRRRPSSRRSRNRPGPSSKPGLVGRAGHFAASYPSGPSLMMYGGGDGSSWIKNVYRYDIPRERWEVIDISDCTVKIPGCYGCSGAIHRNKMYLFGGGDGANFYNDLYIVRLDEEFERKTTRQINHTRKRVNNPLSDMLIVCHDDNELEDEDGEIHQQPNKFMEDEDEEEESYMNMMSRSSDDSSGVNSNGF